MSLTIRPSQHSAPSASHSSFSFLSFVAPVRLLGVYLIVSSLFCFLLLKVNYVFEVRAENSCGCVCPFSFVQVCCLSGLRLRVCTFDKYVEQPDWEAGWPNIGLLNGTYYHRRAFVFAGQAEHQLL